MTTYLANWLRNGFMTAGKSTTGKGGGGKEKVKNADMIKHLLVLLRQRAPSAQVRFKYVPGHAGVEGNEGADVSNAYRASLGGLIFRYWQRWGRVCLLCPIELTGWIRIT
jgi:ribonuclease HI